MNRKRILLAAILVVGPIASQADPIGTMQTFDRDVNISNGDACTDCYVNGWFGEFAPDEGQNGSGDNALLYDLGQETGFHLLTFFGLDDPDEAFLGNYLDAGVLAVKFDAKQAGSSDLFLRAFIFYDFAAGFGSTYSSTGAHILAGATDWAPYTIWFSPHDLLLSPFNDDPNQSPADILTNVSQFGLRHDPGGDGPGFQDRVVAAVYFDNLQLVTVPEPGSLALFAIGLLGLGIAGRKTA